MVVPFCGAELGKAWEDIFLSRVDGFEANLRAFEATDLASGEDVDSKIQRDRARVKQVEGPKIKRAAGEIHPTACMRNDSGLIGICGGGFWHGLVGCDRLRVELSHLTELSVARFQ